MASKKFNATEIMATITDGVNEDVREIALAILRNVVVGTPVGDPTLWQQPTPPPGYVGGHARRNWAVSTARPIDQVRGRAGKGPGDGGASSQAINQGTKRIESYSIRSKRIYIQNNVPYIGMLNNGHSTQAPANFVEKAVQAGTNAGGRGRRETI